MDTECKERFDRIEKRLKDGDRLFGAHTTEIEVIKVSMSSLTRNMNSLTKALWGVTCSIFATLLGFFVWYIQSMGG